MVMTMKTTTAILIFLQLPLICHADNPLSVLVRMCQDQYEKLVHLDYPEPTLGHFTEPSRQAFDQEAYQEIFDKAEKTGLNEQYRYIIKANPTSELLESFISAEHLLMVAYMQRYYGNKDPFAFTDRVGTKNSANNPILGVYINQDLVPITMTRYAYFNGLLESFAKLEKPPRGTTAKGNEEHNRLAKILLSILENLQCATRMATRDPSTKDLKCRTQKCESLYKKLLNMDYPQPVGDYFNTVLDRPYEDEDYKILIDAALTTGLRQQYLSLITGAINKDLLRSFFSQPHLVVVAWMQKRFEHSKSEEATGALLDIYVNDELKRIDITRYSLLNALIEFFFTSRNELMTDEHVKYRNGLLQLLEGNLEKAILTAEILSLLR